MNDEVRRQISNIIIWGVADAYFEALKAQSEIAAHQNSLQQLKSALQYTENLYKIGKVSSLDVLKIKVQISVEEKNLQKAQSSSNNELIRIKRLCYLNEKENFEVEDASGKLYKETQNLTFVIDSLYGATLQNHPALLKSQQEINLEGKQKEIYRLQNRPELFSYGIASWEHGYLPFGDNFNYNIGAGISYTIPFWGGSSYKSRMLQSDLLVEQMSDEKIQTFINIKEEIDMTMNTISDIKSEIANNWEIIELTKETLNSAVVKYQSGQGNIIDVLDAQTILTESTIAYNKSTIAYLQALASLNYLIGNDSYPF